MDARQWLEQVKMLDEMIVNKMSEREKAYALMISAAGGGLGSTPRGKGETSDPVGKAVIRLQATIEDLDSHIDRYVDLRKKVISTLEMLPTNEYSVLYKHYIEYMTFEAIANEKGKSVMQIWRYHNRGLDMLKDMI